MEPYLEKLHARVGITFILVAHDQEEALSVADRIVVMNQGVIEQVGTPMQIYRDPATPFVADFVGKINVLSGRLHPGRDLRIAIVDSADDMNDAAANALSLPLRTAKPMSASVRSVPVARGMSGLMLPSSTRPSACSAARVSPCVPRLTRSSASSPLLPLALRRL